MPITSATNKKRDGNLRIDVRDVPSYVVYILDEHARKNGMSREGYIRDQLVLMAEQPTRTKEVTHDKAIAQTLKEIVHAIKLSDARLKKIERAIFHMEDDIESEE
jgi:hypothetical protein